MKLSLPSVDDAFLVPNESAWQSLERHWEIMVYMKFYKKRFICRLKSRLISLIFLSMSVALSIWNLYQLFCCFENFLHVPIWASTDFLEVICPRYNPVLHYHQSTFFNCFVKFCWNIHFLTSNIVWKWSLQTITVV